MSNSNQTFAEGAAVYYRARGSRRRHAGVVNENDGSSVPYFVEFPDGTTTWAYADEVLPRITISPVPNLEEADPNGVAANAPGSKLDAGKARPALVLGEFPRALAAVVDIGTFGAAKYTPRGWVTVPNGQERYADAAFRHQLEVWKGEVWDNGKGGTGGRHKAQVIWNLLAELELELRAGA